MKLSGLVPAALAVSENGIKHEAEDNHEYEETDDENRIMKLEDFVSDGGDGFLKVQAVFRKRQRGCQPQAHAQQQAGHDAWELCYKFSGHAYLPYRKYQNLFASVEKRVGSRPSRRVAVTSSLPLDGGGVGVGVADRHAAKPGSLVTSRRCSPSPSPPPVKGGGIPFFLPSLFHPLKIQQSHLLSNRLCPLYPFPGRPAVGRGTSR